MDRSFGLLILYRSFGCIDCLMGIAGLFAVSASPTTITTAALSEYVDDRPINCPAIRDRDLSLVDASLDGTLESGATILVSRTE
jgi:hypothetical protein